jgi:hypothetical protein
VSNHRLTLVPLGEAFAICRLAPTDPLPHWATGAAAWSVTRTPDELSIVCPESCVPSGVTCERGWRGWRLAGTFDLTEVTGVLASLVGPLAEARVSVFAVSTYDTDYLWVKSENYERAGDVFTESGHTVHRPERS